MCDGIFYFEDEKAQISNSITPTDVGSSTSFIGAAIPSAKPLLFDVSWEICRKVGGIYTVITSKADITVNEWGDRYALIGPYSDVASREFEEIPASKLTAMLIDKMKQLHNIKVYFGRWLVKGYPKVFLLDMSSSFSKLEQWRTELMGSFAAVNDTETNESIVFGNQVAIFFQVLSKLIENRPILVHFHEWLTGVGLIRLRQMDIHVATLFTTHATLLGRWLAAGNVDLYNVIHRITPDEEAGRRGIYHKHWIETGAARGADIFTTVSEITGYEAEHALGRIAEVITPNGLVVDKFLALHEFQNLHLKNKERITEFIRGHFYGNLDFDLEKTLYIFTAGRREYYNKGVDLFIQSLASLNHALTESGSDVTVVAFIIMPGQTNNYNIESIKGQSLRREIRDTCNEITKTVNQRLYNSLIIGEVPDPKSLLRIEDIIKMKRRVQSIQQNPLLPPIVTHNMVNSDDEILQHLRVCNLINKREDRVKIIYHPEFLSMNSPILAMEYNDFVRGCHLGVFPSYYEPWGYTPAECTVMGVPSISSNLTGFANYMARYGGNIETHGVYIVDRRNCSFEASNQQLTKIMLQFTRLSRRQRIEMRNRTESLSHLLDWKLLGKFYFKARRMALNKVYNIEISVPECFASNEALSGHHE